MADIKRAYTLFHDEARTVQFLNEYSREFLYNEDGDSEDEYDEVRFWNIVYDTKVYFKHSLLKFKLPLPFNLFAWKQSVKDERK